LNHSTQPRVTNSTASRDRHGPSRRISLGLEQADDGLREGARGHAAQEDISLAA